MSETKKGQPPTGGEDQSPSPDSVVTDGPTGLRRFEEVMRRIFRAGRQTDEDEDDVATERAPDR
jgi:hypothetical protein